MQADALNGNSSSDISLKARVSALVSLLTSLGAHIPGRRPAAAMASANGDAPKASTVGDQAASFPAACDGNESRGDDFDEFEEAEAELADMHSTPVAGTAQSASTKQTTEEREGAGAEAAGASEQGEDAGASIENQEEAEEIVGSSREPQPCSSNGQAESEVEAAASKKEGVASSQSPEGRTEGSTAHHREYEGLSHSSIEVSPVDLATRERCLQVGIPHNNTPS